MAQDSRSGAGRGARACAGLGAALAAAVLALAIWIIVPPFTERLVPLAVGAPEVSLWLVGGAAASGALLSMGRRRTRLARAGRICAIAAGLIAALPLVRFEFTARRADAARRALTGDPANPRALRARALVIREVVSGLQTGTALVRRGIRFASAGGVSLTIDVYQPEATGSHPALVQIYGGAWQRGSPGDNPQWATYFAAHGYVVFAIDYRHAPAFHWPAQIDDVRTALEWIAAHGADYGADPNRLALIGRSAGGHLALMAAYTASRPVRAVVSLYGPTDLTAGYREPPRPDPLDVRMILATLTGGTPDDRPEVYREASPITYATRPLPPTLLIHGSRDHIVLPHFAERLHERLRATGTPSLLVQIPWAEHAFDLIPSGPSSQLALFETERFLAWAMK